ncbi:hypothetical protein DFH29DRAFT_909038 [Suillus ampliporus]|nr:hypothetical protein DFH29DRAFT_909038 [Suillus ampliporus]
MPIFPPTRISFVVLLHYLLHASLGSTFEPSTTADCCFCSNNAPHHPLLRYQLNRNCISWLGSFAFADLFCFQYRTHYQYLYLLHCSVLHDWYEW